MQQQLDKLGIPFEFFDAIDGSLDQNPLLKKYNPKMRMLVKGYPMKSGEIACFASHLALWTWCVEHDQPILVLEDDLDINSRLCDLLPHIPRLLENFEFIRLSRLRDGRKIRISPLGEAFPVFKYSFKARGTQGYLIAPAAARKMLSRARSFYLPVDDFMDVEWFHGVAALGFEPILVEHNEEESEIGLQRKEKVKMQYKLFRELYRAADFILSKVYHIGFMMRHPRKKA